MAADEFHDPSTGLWASPSRSRLSKEQLAQMEALQRTKRPPKAIYMPTGGPPGTYLADILFIDEGLKSKNKNYSAILTVVQANTRKAYARPLKTKTATETARELAAMIKEAGDVRTLRTDSGKEFMNKKVEKVFADNKITHIPIDPGKHAPLARLDRFHRTLRTLLERWFIAGKTDHWLSVLPLLIKNYNSQKHTTTKMKPDEADESKIRRDDIRKAQDLATKITIEKDDTVRRVLNRNQFAKGTRPKWSKRTYKVNKRVGMNRFTLQDVEGEYKAHELLAVPETVIRGKKYDEKEAEPVSRKKERKKRQVSHELRREGIEQKNVETRRRTRPPSQALIESIR